MANEPDPPNQWSVYEGDETPDPESTPTPPPPAPETPHVPYGQTPHVPYGATQVYGPVVVTRSSAAPKLIMLIVGLAVLGGIAAAAVAIFATVGGGIDAINGVDPKNPQDFAKMVDAIEDKTGSTEVFSVGLYDGYAIVYVPVDNKTDHSIAYRWDGGGVEEWTKSTSSDTRFDLDEIKPEVIAGMCDPVVAEGEGITPAECYVFINAPDPEFNDKVWFSAGASDDYGTYYSVNYDKLGRELSRTPTPTPTP